MKKREEGYYWVKADGEWFIGEYCYDNWDNQNAHEWYFCGNECSDDESELEEIDERQIKRD
jgi:hypothetical protein